MPTYVYRCSGCDADVEHERHDLTGTRHMAGNVVCGELRRNYRAESAGIAIHNLREEREK
jgi:predicted nucleic acid-binding Zn ribbon protein